MLHPTKYFADQKCISGRKENS